MLLAVFGVTRTLTLGLDTVSALVGGVCLDLLASLDGGVDATSFAFRFEVLNTGAPDFAISSALLHSGLFASRCFHVLKSQVAPLIWGCLVSPFRSHPRPEHPPPRCKWCLSLRNPGRQPPICFGARSTSLLRPDWGAAHWM